MARGDRGASLKAKPDDARRGGTAAEERAPGIFETIQSGYDTLNARPYLIAVPLALDLVLWLGPRFTSPALFAWLARWPSQRADGADLAAALSKQGESGGGDDRDRAGMERIRRLESDRHDWPGPCRQLSSTGRRRRSGRGMWRCSFCSRCW